MCTNFDSQRFYTWIKLVRNEEGDEKKEKKMHRKKTTSVADLLAGS